MPPASIELGLNPFRMPRRLNSATPPEAILSNNIKPSQQDDLELGSSTTAHPSAAGSPQQVSLMSTQKLEEGCNLGSKDASLSQAPSCTTYRAPDVEKPCEHVLGRQVSRAFLLAGFSQKYVIMVYRDGTFSSSLREGSEEDDCSEGLALHTLTPIAVSPSIQTEELAVLPWHGETRQSPRYGFLERIIAKFASPVLASDKMSCQPQPFLQTGLGSLAPEIREEIWKYVCSYHRVTDHDFLHHPAGVEDAMSAVTLNGNSSPWSQVGNPCPAILLVCRSIYEEAQYIYYAHNMFHFTNPSHLHGFLRKIGSGCCEHITTLRLSGVANHSPVFTEEELDEMCRDGVGAPREQFAARTMVEEHPDAQEAALSLQQCKHLKKIYLALKVDEEVVTIFFLLLVYGFWETVVDFTDNFHWVVRRSSKEESERWREDFWERAEPQESIWGNNLEGNERLVEVEITSGLLDGRHLLFVGHVE